MKMYLDRVLTWLEEPNGPGVGHGVLTATNPVAPAAHHNVHTCGPDRCGRLGTRGRDSYRHRRRGERDIILL
jgi:hypothetical protein